MTRKTAVGLFHVHTARVSPPARTVVAYFSRCYTVVAFVDSALSFATRPHTSGMLKSYLLTLQ